MTGPRPLALLTWRNLSNHRAVIRCYLNRFEEGDLDHGDVIAREVDAHDVGRGRVRGRPVGPQRVQRVVTLEKVFLLKK